MLSALLVASSNRYFKYFSPQPVLILASSHQLSLGGQARPSFKRPVSFGLVLNFVKNDSATKDKVHDLLQEREKLASCVAQVYTSAATYLSAITIDNMFEVL